MDNFDYFKVVLVILLSMIFLSKIAIAENEKPSASGDIGIYNNYIWRGFNLNDDSTIIQPSVTIGYKGYSFNMWGNLDTDIGDEKQLNETDLTFSYDKSYNLIGIGLGYIYYGLDAAEDTQELYLSVSLDSLLAPSLTAYRDIAAFPGWYFNIGLSHSFALPNSMGLDIGGSIGYMSVDDGDAFLNDALISLGLAIPFSDYFSVTPSISYSLALSSDAEDALEDANGDSSHFTGGLALSMSF